MRIPPKAAATAVLALLLAAAVAAHLAMRPKLHLAPDLVAAAPAATAAGMPCLYHVMIIHDVYWAAACMKNDPPDNGLDCMLPPERAAALNQAQQEAEAYCERQ